MLYYGKRTRKKENDMEKLSKLPNIGNALEAQLNEVGIKTEDELQQIGSKDAWLRIKIIDSSACINRLYAIEGAISGISWHNLDDATKQDLKEFYENHK